MPVVVRSAQIVMVLGRRGESKTFMTAPCVTHFVDV